MNITLVISSMNAGGAERVMSIMANYWDEKGYKVNLVTLESKEKDFYHLRPGINRIGLNISKPSSTPFHAIFNNFVRLLTLRRCLKRCSSDVVISFVDRMNILTILACFGIRTPIVVSERIDPVKHGIGWAWERLRQILYPFASHLVVQSDDVRRWAEQLMSKDKISVIPNPVLPVKFVHNLGPPCDRKVVAVGRLVSQKGFDLLLNAFARCQGNHPDWSLTILGEGEERSKLEILAKELGILHKVNLPGNVKSPEKVLSTSDIFVLSSRYEGFPNALLEAMACGLPVISTDCQSGPREIILQAVDGILVPPENVDALAEALNKLMSEENYRKQLATNAKGVTSRFGLTKVMGMWERLIKQLST